MKQESQPVVGKHLPPNQHQENPASDLSIQPKSRLFRFMYKGFKYGTVLTVIVFILLSGISILGDTSSQVEANRRIFDVYRNSQEFTTNVDRINTLFDKQSSKFISNKAVNLYLNEKPQDGSQPQELEQQFNDLSSFTEFLVSQKYQGGNVLYLPLNLNEQKGSNNIVPESHSSRLLEMLKNNVQKTLQKNKISQPQSVKELKWSRVKKLIDNSKMDELIQLVKDNIIDSIWQWVDSSPSVIVLTVENLHQTEKSSKIKKSLNKWIKQNSQHSEIIILSQYPINSMYEVKEEDHFKSYQVKVNLDSIDQKKLCELLSQSFNVKEGNCQSVKVRFGGLVELEQFVEGNSQQHATTIQGQLVDENSQAGRILQQVCANGHVKHYFYQNQQNVNKVLSKSKKGKKSRLDRELEALIVKWSHLKKSMGLNRIKDILNTLTTDNNGENKLSLRDMNQLGLVYDFDLNELKWRDEQEKLGYEIRSGRVCKDGRGVEEIEEQITIREEQQQREGEQYDQHGQEHGEEQQGQQQQEEEVNQQEEYEQSFIDRSVEQKGEGQQVDQEQQQGLNGDQQEQQQEQEQLQDQNIDVSEAEEIEEKQLEQDQVNEAEERQGQQQEQVDEQQIGQTQQQQEQVEVQQEEQQEQQQQQQAAVESTQQVVTNPSQGQIDSQQQHSQEQQQDNQQQQEQQLQITQQQQQQQVPPQQQIQQQ